MNKIKSPETILDKWYKPRMHWKTFNRGQVIRAMEEYASQFKQPDISEDVESDNISDALKFISDELGDEVELRKMTDNWCIGKLGNNSEAMDKADKMFAAARDVFYSKQPIPTVDEDECALAHKIGVNIMNRSFEVIDGAFRKIVVEVPVIISEFSKEGIDIIEYPDF